MVTSNTETKGTALDEPSSELEQLRQRLEEAEETLLAIRSGKVDAVVVSSPGGERVFVLKSAEQPYRVFVETMNEGAVTLLPDGAIAYCNRRFAEMVCTPLEQVIGVPFEKFVAPDRQAQFRLLVVRGLADTCRDELPLLSRDGSTIWTQLSLSPVAIESARGVCLVARDVTEQKRADDEIHRLNEELEERVRQRTNELETANRELESFSYSISHDLRSPLRAICGFSTIILNEFGPQLPPEAQRMFERILGRAEQMGNLITDLLAFSRLGRHQLRKRAVKPADLVREAFADLAAEQQGRRVETVVGDLPVCRADPVLLRQVFMNLLSNALKFTRTRDVACIEIGAAKVADLPPEFATKAVHADTTATTAYFVRDNGVGFDMRYANKLFGVFERLHAATEYEGTGVGLAIVQRIIHRHGGLVWAAAAVDQGATFYFTLDGRPEMETAPDPVSEDQAV